MSTRIHLQEAFKLALSISLFYWFTLSMNWAMPKYGVLAIAVVSTATAGDSLLKGVIRSFGTILGAMIGFALLVIFPQNPFGLMLAVAVLLTFATYMAQTSRNPGVWTIAAIMFILVWFVGYINPQNSFHFAVFRILETVTGVLFYTLVSVLLWPVSAESRLMAEGSELWTGLADLIRRLRRQPDDEEERAALTDVRHRVAGSLMQLESTLPAVYADTWTTVSRKPIWECLRTGLRSLVEAMDHWQLIQEDLHGLNLERDLPGLERSLDALEGRLVRSGEIWERGNTDGETDDDRLLEPLVIEQGDQTTLNPPERAILTLYIEALEAVDQASREVLRSLRALVELDPAGDFICELEPAPLRQRSLWSFDRLLNSLLPAVAWLVGFNLWITFNVPSGPVVALLASIFSIVLTLHPMNLFDLLKWLLVSMWIVVAPVYLFVLPRLDSTAELLGVVFIVCFVLSLIGTTKPVLRLTSLILFAMLIDISNHQSYSVMKIILMGMVLTIAVSLAVVIYQLLRPLHPVRVLERELRHFFAACARVMEGFGLHELDEQKGRRLRKATFESRILPAPHRLDHLVKDVQASDVAGGQNDRLEKIVESAEVLGLRLEALEYTHERAIAGDSELGEVMATMSGNLGERLQGIFERWSAAGADESRELYAIQEELDRRLDEMQAIADAGAVSADDLRRSFVLVGSLRGLLNTMHTINPEIVPVREFLHEYSQ
jgi:uncharacterized membrane protein YccC